MSDGPRATDTLANERTFLAYLRTALNFAAFGFVVARFALFTREIAGVLHLAQSTQRISTTFGTIIAIFGAAIGIFGAYRYVVADRALSRGENARMSPVIAIVSGTIVACIGIAVGMSLLLFR